ncbi:MAG TPA: hypothetical protein VM510_00985 [Caulifigura sp.]|nr:hypothetical protein [Caulifigura sp.]
MKRLLRKAAACTALGACLPGCTGMLTQQAVTAFANSVQTKDLARLKSSTSSEFEKKALRLSESAQDLRLINLPQGKATVVSIEEQGPTQRIVKVQHGEAKKPIEYHLVREKNGKWVVDDVLVSQKKDGDEKAVWRSISDQMNLLLSVRELITDWQSKDRERVLSATTPDLRHELDGLPPAWLDKVTSRVAGEGPLRQWRPEASMKENRAVVKLSRSGAGGGRDGEVLMEFKLTDDRWLLEDASWPGADHSDVSSLRQLSIALTFARKFLEAYGAEDKPALAGLCTSELNRCLEGSELKRVPLPVVDLLTRPFEVRQHRDKLDVLLAAENETFTLNVQWQNEKGEIPTSSTDKVTQARVEEITIYDRKEEQVKRVSSMFQAHALVEYYAEVLATGDVEQLRVLSTTGFNDRVWRRFPADVLRLIHLPEIENAPPRLVTTVFNGPVTEVTVMQGERALTYVLHTEQAEVKVDDVLLPVMDRPSSLRKHLELLGPVYQLADGIRRQDRAVLMASSGNSLDRIVWEQVKEAPEIGVDIVPRLIAPVVAIRAGDLQSRVTLSDGQHVAEIELEEERGRFVVADVKFVEGEGRPPVAMLQSMRHSIARDMQARSSREILPASAEMRSASSRLVEPL